MKFFKTDEPTAFFQIVMLTLASLVLQILMFVYRIIITRFSGAGGMGIFQLAMPYYSIIASISLSGITMSVTRLTVEKTATDNKNLTATVVHRSIQIFLALLSCTAIVTFLFPDFIAGSILGDVKTKAAMLMIIPCLFFTGFENIYKAFFYGVKNIRPNIISETSELSIRIITIFIFLYLNKDSLNPEKTAFYIISAMVVSEVFSFVFLSLCYKKYQRKNKIKYIYSKLNIKKITSEIANIAVPISASSLLMTIISSVNTILIPKRLVVSGMTQTQAVETLGILGGMAGPLVMLPLIFIGPMMNVVIPRITKDQKLGNTGEVNRKIAQTIKTCSFLAFPAMSVVAAIGRPMCILMYKNEMAGNYILPLTLSSVFVYFQSATGSVLNAVDKQRQLAVYNVIDGIIHIIFTYVFTAIPAFNVYGFMLGNFASSLTGSVLNLTTIIIHTKLKFNIGNWLLLPAISGLYTGFMTHFIYNFCSIKLSFNSLSSIIISVLFSILIYIAVLELRDISIVKYMKKQKI